VSELFRALAEPRRREILKLLQNTELAAGEIAVQFDVTRPAISQHLRVLERAGLVRVRRAGTKRLYQVRPEAIEELAEFLSEFWDVQLKMLKHAAEREERRKEKHVRTARRSGTRNPH
jgi:DNA-binding transcriptional ArsR family regulator